MSRRTDDEHDFLYPRAKKSLGQNFLTDRGVVDRIAAAVGAGPGDRVLEIGPGRGALTSALARDLDLEHGGTLRALEKDRDLAARLEEEYPLADVVCMDALAFSWESLDSGWKVAGNLPYNVASRLIWDFASRAPGYERAVFMVQHEVALRLSSGAGSRKYGALGAWVQTFSEVEYLFKVGAEAFRPRPRVESAVVRLRPRAPGPILFSHEALNGVLKLCFQNRRKQLKRILKEFQGDSLDAWFESFDVSPADRPENVTPQGFQGLAKCLQNHFSP